MAALERRLCGVDRERDFRCFLADRGGLWQVLVVDGADGGLDGFLVSVRGAAAPATGVVTPTFLPETG